ncbi:vacuole membrane protein 1 isoform X3 [Aethina tumida]|nr:vacuole membrane protein 1 isoform X3 [Aethina tumida]
MTGGGRRKDANVATSNGNEAIGNDNTSAATDRLSSREKEARQREREERAGIVLWRRPLLTLELSFKETLVLSQTFGRKILDNKLLVAVSLISVLSTYVLLNTKGPHHDLVQNVYGQVLWCLYWTGLGILSSVGLGTGLHTFLLYLGPHIARVTLAAYECGGTNFPEPPYPDEIICPSTSDGVAVSIWSIMSKVRLEAMCWGAGTALGELPPYFMAKAARLSGIDPDDEDEELQEFEELQKKQQNKDELTLIERGKVFVEELVQKVGFLGILACASIPNPLFDLAGITCGHFLVPFWTFFGATLIGKAVIKMHIQKLFVIVAFNESLLNKALELVNLVPVLGARLQVPFRSFLDNQKNKLHKNEGAKVAEGGNLLATVFECFVFAMILYFVVSIVNSLAQSYHKRLHKKKSSKVSKD